MNQPRISAFAAHASLFAAALIYGINYFSLKDMLDQGHDPLGILAVRTFFACLIFLAIHQFFIREKITQRSDYIRLLLCALFGITINQTFYIWGVSNTEVVNAAVLMAPTPVFVFLAAWLMKNETMTLRKVAGLSLSFGGALLLIFTNVGKAQFSHDTMVGDIMIMVNAASYGVYLALVKPLLNRYNPITITLWIFLLGGIPNIIIGWSGFQNLQFNTFTSTTWMELTYLIVFSTVLAYFFNAFAMRRLDASAAGVYIYVQPIIVTLISAFLNKGGLTEVKLLCMAVIFSGVYLVTANPLKVIRREL